MATEKADLTRAGTMEVTAQVGQQFLEKNLTDWKKPHLMDHFDEENNKDGHDNNVDGDKPSPDKANAKLPQHNTMIGTAKEAEAILEKAGKPDEDALTRGQQKKIEDIAAEEPSPKKAKLARDGTMAVTAKEGKELLSGEKLGDTRGETKSRRGRKSGVSKGSTMNKAIEEAKELYGDIDVTSERRSLRKRPDPPKATPKRAGTMQRTAKEGKEFVKGKGRGRGRPKKTETVAKEVEEEEEEEEEEEKAEKEEEKEEETENSSEEKEEEKSENNKKEEKEKSNEEEDPDKDEEEEKTSD